MSALSTAPAVEEMLSLRSSREGERPDPNRYLVVGGLHAGALSFGFDSEREHQADQSYVVCALRLAQIKTGRRNKSS